MSENSLMNEIVYWLRIQLKRNKITKPWIQEWCTAKITEPLRPGEKLVELKAPGMHMWVVIRDPKWKATEDVKNN